MRTMPDTDPAVARPTTSDVPRWARVCDGVTLGLGVVVLSMIAFGPLEVMAGGRQWVVSTLAWPGVLALAVAGLRHWRHPHPQLPARLWRGCCRVASDPAWRAAGWSFVGVRVPVLAVGLLAVALLGFPQPSPRIPITRGADHDVLNLPVRWDAAWYLRVALDGYRYDPADRGQQNIAFFPGYPALLRVSGALLGARAPAAGLDEAARVRAVADQQARVVLGGWLLALICGTWAMAKLYRLAVASGAQGWQATAVVMLASAYPFAYFQGALYTESIFLLSAIAMSTAFVRRDYLTAAAWGVLVGLVRPNGCMISVPLAIVATQHLVVPRTLGPADGLRRPMDRRGWLVAMATAAVPGVAMLAFTLWEYAYTGVGFAWLEAHKAWGRQPRGLGYLVDLHTYLLAKEGPLGYVLRYPIDFVNASATAFAVAMAVPVARRLGLAWAVFVLINVLPPLGSGGFLSLGRVTSTLFPVFVALGLMLRPATLTWWLAAWGATQGLFAALFFTWRPIY